MLKRNDKVHDRDAFWEHVLFWFLVLCIIGLVWALVYLSGEVYLQM